MLILRQSGNSVTGARNGGKGTLSGRVWTGTFRFSSTIHGIFKYTFSEDLTSFSGPWANSTDSNSGTDTAVRE